MTRDEIVESFESAIDEIGTSAFDNVDQFINLAIQGIFKRIMDPKMPNHPDAKGFERDIYVGELIAPCKHWVAGQISSTDIISVTDIEAEMPAGRNLFRISSFEVNVDGTDFLQAQLKSSPEASVQKKMPFYSSKCRLMLERVSDGYRIHSTNAVEEPEFRGIAISYPREVSLAQQEVDLADFLKPSIVWNTAMLAGVSIRDSEYLGEVIAIVNNIGV